MVTKGGSSISLGSPPWQNLCKAWSSFKPLLRRTEPRNMDEWKELPLWRPHIHHKADSKAQCSTQAQNRLRDAGLLTLGDLTEADGHIRPWNSLPVNQEDSNAHRAFTALVANIKPLAPFEFLPGPNRLFFGGVDSESDGHIWEYDVQQQFVTSNWPAIRDLSLPINTFQCKAGVIRKITRTCPPNAAVLHRILVRNSNRQDGKRTHFGFWSAERNLLLQYKWSDGSLFLDTNTSQLCKLQASQRFRPHKAATKCGNELGCTLPVDLWSGMWLTFRGANENTFLWQLFYRAIATQRWRFPSLPPDDSQLKCTRCDLGAKEDLVHCIWGCPQSQPCWQWCSTLLTASSGRRVGGLRGSLIPAHVFVASPLPAEWLIPSRFWQILRAVLCWQVWKSPNEHFMANRSSDPRRTIRKTWHRFSMYIRKEWNGLTPGRNGLTSGGRFTVVELV